MFLSLSYISLELLQLNICRSCLLSMDVIMIFRVRSSFLSNSDFSFSCVRVPVSLFLDQISKFLRNKNINVTGFQVESNYAGLSWTWSDVLDRLLNLVSDPIVRVLQKQTTITLFELSNYCCHLLARVLAELVHQCSSSDVRTYFLLVIVVQNRFLCDI